MLTPTIPVPQAALTSFVIVSVNITLEPSLAMTVLYSPCDAQGNPTGGPNGNQLVRLGAAALTTFQNTAGSPKAKLYAALQTELPALAGAVT